MHYEGENPSFLPYMSIVWFPQGGSHLMINDPPPKLGGKLVLSKEGWGDITTKKHLWW